jgi:hypothetical protein
MITCQECCIIYNSCLYEKKNNINNNPQIINCWFNICYNDSECCCFPFCYIHEHDIRYHYIFPCCSMEGNIREEYSYCNCWVLCTMIKTIRLKHKIISLYICWDEIHVNSEQDEQIQLQNLPMKQNVEFEYNHEMCCPWLCCYRKRIIHPHVFSPDSQVTETIFCPFYCNDKRIYPAQIMT